MSELIAEARVLVTPDTTTFRALLTSQLAAATKGVTVPVGITPVAAGGAAAAAAVRQQTVAAVAGAEAEAARIARVQDKFAADRVTAETRASAARIAAKEKEVAGLIAAERAGLAGAQAEAARIARIQDQAAAARTTAATRESVARIAVKEKEVASLLAAERANVEQQAAAQAKLVTAQTKASDVRIAAKQREVALLLAADRKLEESAAKVAAANAAASARQTAAASAAATAAQTRSLSGLASGAGSAALSLVGLRGATLAATGPFLAGAAGAIALSKALGTATSFNQELSVFAATTGATAEQMERVSSAARELGRDITLPGVSAGAAAKTMAEFAKAGLSVEEAIAATRGGLQLATAAQLEYTDAVTLTANALNAFNLSGDQAVHVADVLANASNQAQGGIEDTALALRQAAGAAAVVGVSFEDTVALLGLLAKNGLTGSDAGTALRTAFLRLVNPSKQARDILDGLNVQLRDLEGNVRPQVFAEFALAQQNLARSTQQANAAIVFGQDAFRAFGFLGREGLKGLQDFRRGLDQIGTAQKIANARQVGLAGSTANLKNQLDDLGITVGQVADGPLALFVDGLAELVSFAGSATTEVVGLGKAIGGILPVPAGSGQAFDFAKTVFGFTNPITGLASPIGNIKRFGDLFGDEEEKAADEIDKGGEAIRKSIVEAAEKGLQATFGFAKIAPAIKAQMATISSSLSLDLAVAQARGNESAELSILREMEGRQEAFLNAVLDRPRTAKNIALAKQAASNLDQTRSNIASIVEGQRSAARATADKITAAASEADASVLNALAAARANQENAVARAVTTEGAADDIRENVQLRALIRRQIETVRAQVGDVKTRQAAVQSLVAATIALTGTIKGLRQARLDERAAQRQAILDRTEENADLRIQIAEARGNKDAVVRLLDARIKIAQRQVAAAKKAKEGVLAAILELEELKQKRRELLKEASEDEAGGSGTTAFDLLTQAAGRFTGGNIIGAAQPFAGPTEFTADLSQFLRRSSTTSTAGVAAKSPFAGFTGSADRLVEAINRNTAALNGGEEGPPVRKGKRPPVSKAVGNTFRGWWAFADQARDQVEGAG